VGAAYGDAFLAALASGLAEPDAKWARIETVITPGPGVAERYAELFGLYRNAYADTASTSHALAAIQESEGSQA
jgi:xylulokinase